MFSYKHSLTTINYFWRLYTTFGRHILLLTAIYYFWRAYTTFNGYILLLTAIYYIRQLHITFDGYILLLALLYCDFAITQVFPVISFICGLNIKIEFNINFLALIQFCFFCSSTVSPVNFNLPFWKRCFIRNTQMIKMWNFQALKETDLEMFSRIKLCYSNCNLP